jgi:GNAT superfamily N-acetyltransferase
MVKREIICNYIPVTDIRGFRLMYKMEGEMKPQTMNINDRERLWKLFDGWEETMIWSCLQGHMGDAWADDRENPKSAQIINGDFCFFAGEPNEQLALNITNSNIILAPQNDGWEKLIQEVYGEKARKTVRYAIKKERDVFDKERLSKIAESLNKDYELRLIDKAVYEQIIQNSWSRDWCSQFMDYRDYETRGIGVAALHNGQVVSGASSYTIYDEGIEIQIDTRKDYRRRGLALCCGARLILECLEKGLYPSWDAHNRDSVALAEKLGYHFDREYTVFTMDNRG